MQETELKSIIDEETYAKVKRAFNWNEVKEQENHYYTDYNGVLRQKRVTVRIRVIDGVPKIQVKQHKNSDSPLQICEETEFMTDGVPEMIDAKTARQITGVEVGELYRMGAAVTKRRTVKRGGSELCLDKTKYFDRVDYEVELEYEDKMSAELLMKLTSLGVEFNKKCVGKFARFLAEWEKRNGD